MKIVEASFILQAADDIEKDVHSSNSVYSDKVLNVKDVPYVLRSLVRHGGIDVDVEPEKPRAKWLKGYSNTWKCSNCNGVSYSRSKYCKDCGSRMENPE